MTPDLLVELLINRLPLPQFSVIRSRSSTSSRCIWESDKLTLRNAKNDVMGGGSGIVVTGEVCTPVEDRFEKVLDESPFTEFSNLR